MKGTCLNLTGSVKAMMNDVLTVVIDQYRGEVEAADQRRSFWFCVSVNGLTDELNGIVSIYKISCICSYLLYDKK